MKVTLLLGVVLLFLVGMLTAYEAPGSSRRSSGKRASATFAGGCFWCVEADFEKVEGVFEVISGYAGGSERNPTYEQVASGRTGHVEAAQIIFDPDKVTYRELLDVFWRHVDPTDGGGQFVDRGAQYRTAIFYHDPEQKRLAEESRKRLDQSGVFDRPLVTEIRALNQFYPAEEYHQDYYEKKPLRYKYYRSGSGRDQFLEKVWKNRKTTYRRPPDSELRKLLTPLQYQVTRQDATEPPFRNDYWDHKQEGIYVDVVSGEPLFSSTDKFESGTGWPSFTRPLEPENLVEKEDRSLFMVRTELRSRNADSHLGHLFPDGPAPTGLRYCINSAALRFVPREELEKLGYGRFLNLFTRAESQ